MDPAPGDTTRVGVPHPEIFAAFAPGVELLLDDGLRVESCSSAYAITRVIARGPLSDHKGVSVVGAVLPVSAVTEKDRIDLAFALDVGADWVALSFVQRPEDIGEMHDIIAGRAAVMAKLETPAATDCLWEIVRVSDGPDGRARRPWRRDAARAGAADTAAVAGKFPMEAVCMMDRIIREVEQDPEFRR
jgi:pyruvate kinase